MKSWVQINSSKRLLWLAAGCLAVCLQAGCASTARQGDESLSSSQTGEGAEPEVIRVPTSEEVMYRVFAAEYLGAEGDLPAAVEEYLVAAMESEDPEIARRATRVAFAAESWQQAAMAADRWAMLDPENIAAHESAAAAMLNVGDYFGAEYQIMQILDLLEDSTEAWLMISNLLARSGDPKQADATLEQILASRENADVADVFYARSQLAVRSHQLEKAYELARQAVQQDPERVEFLTWAGRLALNLKFKEEGLAYIRRAWELDPGDHDLALAYADLLARNQRADEARAVMREMPQSPDVMLSRILFELAANDRGAAEELFEELADTDFSDAEEKVFFQAQAAEALGLHSQAIAYYAKVKTGDRALAAAIRRVELIALDGDIETARSELAELRLQADDLIVEESWLAEARILREAGERDEAFQVLDTAVRQFPRSVPLRYTRSLLAAELGWVDVAENDLRMILTVQPENASALNALGYTLADQTERYEEAEALIRQAFILQPNEPSIIDSMGWIAYRLGRYDEAVKFLEKAWGLDKNPEIAVHLGEVLWVKGEREKAVEIWKQAAEADAQHPVLLETLERLEVSF